MPFLRSKTKQRMASRLRKIGMDPPPAQPVHKYGRDCQSASDLKAKAISTLNTTSHRQAAVRRHMELNSMEFKPKLISYTNQLDHIRKVNVVDAIPELAELFRN